MFPETNRREFLRQVTCAASAPGLVCGFASRQQSQPADHHATGTHTAATSTSREATDAALWALREGGSAADAYIAAAITQTVSEPGLTSIAGAFSMRYFDAARRRTVGVIGRLGPAAAEPYDFDRLSPVTQTGRAMPVPGFIAGVHEAHRRHGRLPWKSLFGPAIQHAENGFLVNPRILAAAERKGVLHPGGQRIWKRDGKMLQQGQLLFQPEAAAVLTAIADGGPEAFYEGKFARSYVKTAGSDGGKITLDDLKGWKNLIRAESAEPVGNYRGYQVMSGDLIVYALHLNEAIDLSATGSAATSPESVYRQIRIMEEVFLSTKDFANNNDGRFRDPEFARKRADFVVTSDRRRLTLDAIFNTCFLVIRDRDGNIAWGTHSINTPTAFGAGIVVSGIYAAHAINRDHMHGAGASAPGISTSYALFRDGVPRLIVGSPGFGFVHGPYQYGTGIVEWGLSPTAAMMLPRFSLPNSQGSALFEQHYDNSVFEMLDEKRIAYGRGRPSTSTGLVGALSINDDSTLHVVQDGRRIGFARAS